MLADFYFYEKRLNPFIKFDNKYYFNYDSRKYILKIDVFLKTNTWIFVIIDDEHLNEHIKKIQLYNKSKVYKKLFDKFPVVAIITTDILKVKKIIEEYKQQGLTYQWLDYEKVMNWKYSY